MQNPGINELQDSDKFELIAELSHDSIKEFVLEQLSLGGKLVRWYMFYQLFMISAGIFLFIHALILAYRDNFSPLIYIGSSFTFCFSLLIVLHELLHGAAIKISGAKKVNYGAYFRRFIFYAEADRFVMNKSQFRFVALTPLIAIKLTTSIACAIFFTHPLVYFFGFIMCAHSLFCAGDIGLLSLFYRKKNDAIFTYDVKAEKKSYYYRRL